MAGYVVVQVDIKNPEGYLEYAKVVTDTLKPFGGRFLVRGGAVENLEGEWNPSRFVIIEFDSVEQAKAWWSSEEYGPAKRMRQQNAHSEMIVAQGV